MGAWHQLSKSAPTSNTPQSSLLSSFCHYGDLFMNTTGSGDYIPFTTPGVYFQCSTYTVSYTVFLNAATWVSNSSAIKKLQAFSASRRAHPWRVSCKGLQLQSCLWRYSVVFSEGKHAPPPTPLLSPVHPPPIPHSLQLLTSRHACVNAPCFDRELFFIWIIMGLLVLEKYPAFVAF